MYCTTGCLELFVSAIGTERIGQEIPFTDFEGLEKFRITEGILFIYSSYWA